MAPAHNFFCELCQKGYARQNEFAAHETSYEHQHAERLGKLKKTNASMMRKESSSTRPKASAGMTIKPISMPSSSSAPKGPKKGFKTAFAATKDEDAVETADEIKMKELSAPEAKQLARQVNELRAQAATLSRALDGVARSREAAERRVKPDGAFKDVWEHRLAGCECGSKSEKSHVWHVRDMKLDYWPWNRLSAEEMQADARFADMLKYREQERKGWDEWKYLTKKVAVSQRVYEAKYDEAIKALHRVKKPKTAGLLELWDKFAAEVTAKEKAGEYRSA